MKELVESCIRVLDKTKVCAARPQEDGRHADSKINRAVSIKTTIEDSKRFNIPAKRERLKTVSRRRGIDETKNF